MFFKGDQKKFFFKGNKKQFVYECTTLYVVALCSVYIHTLRDWQSLWGWYKSCRGRIWLVVHLDKTLSTSESEEGWVAGWGEEVRRHFCVFSNDDEEDFLGEVWKIWDDVCAGGTISSSSRSSNSARHFIASWKAPAVVCRLLCSCCCHILEMRPELGFFCEPI